MTITNYFVSDVEKYKEYRESTLKYFASNNTREIKEVIISPCNNYSLTVYKYQTAPNCWSFLNIIVKSLITNQVITEVKRNYSNFYYYFYNDYLIIGEDYQGYSIINLVNQTVNIYLPDEAYKGFGFCWSNIVGIYNNKLIVEGCYWACPYECVVYDITNIEQLPLPELDRFDCEGWATLEDNKLVFKDEKDYRLSDNKSFDDLSNEEQRQLIDIELNDSSKKVFYSKTVITKIVEL
jgi:hypothetical protein